MLSLLFYLGTFIPGHTPAAFDPGRPIIKQMIVEDVQCYHTSTGKVKIVVAGGQPPYQYSLDGNIFQKQDLFENLRAGHYNIYLKDAAGGLNTSSFTVKEPEKILFSPSKTTNSSCCEPNGAILVHAQGGTGKIRYQLNDSPFQSSGYFKGLSGGYTVIAKDSLGCKATLVVKVDDLNKPMIDFLNSTEVSCFNGNNGSITVYTIGGSGTLKYSVDSGKNWQTNAMFAQLKAGTYMVKVKDETGCSDSLSIVISQPHALEVSALHTGTAKNESVIVLYSIGGTGSHMYSLNGTDYQSALVFTVNNPGDTIYVKDIAGCTGISKITGDKQTKKIKDQ